MALTDTAIRNAKPKAAPYKVAYNCAEHLPERRKMMQAWADYLDGLKQGADVVPLRRAMASPSGL
jgi:hypothetical protein